MTLVLEVTGGRESSGGIGRSEWRMEKKEARTERKMAPVLVRSSTLGESLVGLYIIYKKQKKITYNMNIFRVHRLQVSCYPVGFGVRIYQLGQTLVIRAMIIFISFRQAFLLHAPYSV